MWRSGLLAALLAVAGAREASAFQLFWIDDNGLTVEVTGAGGSCPMVPKANAVLFVHGHPLEDSTSTTPHFERNWIEGTSFKATLDLAENAALDIEDYYIEFLERDRSIVVDANKVGEAIALIQSCQDSTSPDGVKVAVVAYSKGTISTRLYLRARQVAEQGQDLSSEFPGDAPLTPHSPAINPVSEFVALASPNHGLRLLSSSLPIRQLGNGRRPGPLCTSYGEPLATDFMSRLNGVDANGDWSGAHETPAARADGAPVADGTLFVSLYDNDDVVGGDLPDPNDCATPNRAQAFNRGQFAENIQLDVAGAGPLTVHANSVKDAEIICRALYSVVHHRVPPASSTPNCDTTSAGLPIIPHGTGVVLALDHSGSMGIPACPGCGAKQAVLREAVEIFLATWQALGRVQDKVGITYFRTGLSHFAAAGSGDTLVPLLPDTTALVADLQTEAANSSGLTAMGGALQAGILDLQGVSGQLRGVGPNRHVILFTDGLQNVNPKIQDDASQQLVIADAPGFVDAGIPVQLSAPVAAHGVIVDTIGIGVSPASQALLEDLSQETGGESRFSTDTAVLNQFFTMTLMDTLRGSSPQLVAYRYGTMANDEQVETFSVNHGPRQIVLRLSWPQGHALDFRVEKDGVDVTAAGRWTAGGFYRIFALDLPASPAGSPVQAGGEWRMVIRGRAGLAYEAAAIVDEPQFDYRVSIAGGNAAVGTPLELEVRLFLGGRPLDRAEVTARVLRPTDSIGNVLAAYPVVLEPAGITFEPTTTPGQRAALAALQDERVWRRLQPASETVSLSAAAPGRYRASFDKTTIPGTYTVAFEIAVEDSQLGSLRRTQSVSTQLRAAAATLEGSAITLVRLADSDRGRELVLHLTPRDRFGNHLGPDLGETIGIKVPRGVEPGAVQDFGNGTYAVPLIVPAGADPEVTLAFGGEVLYSGTLSPLEPPAERASLVLWIALAVGWALALILALRWLLTRRAA